MKKTLINLTKANAVANMVVANSKVTAKNTVKEINAELTKEVLYPCTGDIDGLDTATSYATLYLASLGTVRPYKDGLCAKHGRKKICEIYFVKDDGRIHIYADGDQIKAWSKKYKGFLTETKSWSRFEFLYSEFLRMVKDSGVFTQ